MPSYPTLAKTWQFDVNKSLPATGTIVNDFRQWIWNVKNSMVTFGSNPWTVAGSGDGTVAAAMDGVDRWPNSASLVLNSSGNPHSWIVLQNTGMPGFQVCFDLNTTGTQAGMSIAFTWDVPFSGAGLQSNRPTSANQVVALNGGNAILSTTVPGNMRLHAMQSTDGHLTRIVTTRANLVISHFGFDRVKTPIAAWNTPNAPSVAWFIGTSGGTPGDIPVVDRWLGVTRAEIHTRFNYPAGTGTTTAVGTTSLTPAVPTANTVGASYWTTTSSVINGFNSEWPIAPLCLTMPGPQSFLRGRLGMLQDIWGGVAASSINMGDNYPVGGTKEFIQFRCMILPWNGSTPVLT